MSSTNHYDQNLLGSAPAATKGQLQEGYNVDLLDERRNRKPAAATPPLLANHDTDLDSREKYGGTAAAAHTPFYRTTKGKLIMLIAAIAIIAVVVGGAVGGTVGKHKSSNDSVIPKNGNSTSTTTSPFEPESTGGSGTAPISTASCSTRKFNNKTTTICPTATQTAAPDPSNNPVTRQPSSPSSPGIASDTDPTPTSSVSTYTSYGSDGQPYTTGVTTLPAAQILTAAAGAATQDAGSDVKR